MTSAYKTDEGLPGAGAGMAHVVAAYLDPEQFPARTSVYGADLADEEPERPDADDLPFELSFGIDRFLDGIEAWAVRSTRSI